MCLTRCTCTRISLIGVRQGSSNYMSLNSTKKTPGSPCTSVSNASLCCGMCLANAAACPPAKASPAGGSHFRLPGMHAREEARWRVMISTFLKARSHDRNATYRNAANKALLLYPPRACSFLVAHEHPCSPPTDQLSKDRNSHAMPRRNARHNF